MGGENPEVLPYLDNRPMLRKISPLIFLFSFLFFAKTFSQSLPTYNHYYIHPYFFNPSYMASKNYTEASVIHRQQWVGIEGAPVFTQLSLIHPFSNKVATGLNLYNYKSGALATTTTSAQASFSYTLDINPDTYFSFGISGGAARNAIDTDAIDISDPVFSGQLDKSFFLEGQVGLNFQFRKLNVGISLPQLFKRSLTSSKDLQKPEFNAFNSFVSSAGYRFEFSPDITFEPIVMYRREDQGNGKIIGFGTLYLKQVVWVGGAYKQDYGPSVHAGLQISDKIQLGYSYEFGSTTTAAINNKTHEFRIAVQFGKRKVNRQQSTRAAKEETEDDEETAQAEETKIEVPLVEEQPQPSVITETSVPKNQQPEPVVTRTEKEEVKTTEKIDRSLTETETKSVVISEVSPTITQPAPKEETIREARVQEKPPTAIIEKKPLTERVVKATTSQRADELRKGVYVVVGVFGVSTNAKKHIEQLQLSGYSASMGYNSGTKLNYVYVHGGESLEAARERRDELRKIEKFQFPNAWVLVIE